MNRSPEDVAGARNGVDINLEKGKRLLQATPELVKKGKGRMEGRTATFPFGGGSNKTVAGKELRENQSQVSLNRVSQKENRRRSLRSASNFTNVLSCWQEGTSLQDVQTYYTIYWGEGNPPGGQGEF